MRAIILFVMSDPAPILVMLDEGAHRRSELEEHRENEELYRVWTRALAGKVKRQPDSELVLKVDDVVFFGL